MTLSSRRDFLAHFGKVAACAGLSTRSIVAAHSIGEPLVAHAWTTSKNRRYEPIDLYGSPSSKGSPSGEISVNPTISFQHVLGFGGALTESSCYNFKHLDKDKRNSLLRDLFGDSGLQLSMARISVGSSDYSEQPYTLDDASAPDLDLTHFSIEYDRTHVIPILQECIEICPKLLYVATPWSPPAWMKSGNSILGGSMRKIFFEPYADYFFKFIKGYSEAGIGIYALTVQNEPDTDQNGRMPATLWGQEYEIEFIKNFLGPKLKRNGLDTKIWILDHNYNLYGRVLDELDDPDLNRYVDGVAWHNYGGTPEAMTRIHDAFPSKHQYWTEGGPDITSSDYETDWTKWSLIFSGALLNWSRCILVWNLLLDEKGLPKIGPFSCGGLLTVNSKDNEISRSGQYWAVAHYSKVVRRDALRIASSGQIDGIRHIAFVNPDGSCVVVITNSGTTAHIVQCILYGQIINVPLDPDSVTTVLWH